MVDPELMEQFSMLAELIGENRKEIQRVERTLRGEMKEMETRIYVHLENTVTSQIKALFDGYQGALENQALLKIANESMAREIDDIKTRLSALESRPA